MEFDEKDFKEKCKAIYSEVSASENLKYKVLHAAVSEEKRRFGWCRTASAIVAAATIGVLLLGGGVVYALNHAAIKDYFFRNSDKEFETVYQSLNREYLVGKHRVQLQGVINDKEIGVGYLSFAVCNEDGTPVEKITGESGDASLAGPGLGRHTSVDHICAGEDDIYVVMTYSEAYIRTIDHSNFYLKFFTDKEIEDEDKKEFRFTVLDKASWNRLKNEVGELKEEELMQYDLSEYPETGVAKPLFNRAEVQPELMEILEKYGLEEIHYEPMTTQVVNTDKCRLIIGRTDVMLDLNQNEEIGSLVLKREDGTETVLIQDGRIAWNGKHGVGETASNQGTVYRFEYGYVLGEKEKVEVILDGTVY